MPPNDPPKTFGGKKRSASKLFKNRKETFYFVLAVVVIFLLILGCGWYIFGDLIVKFRDQQAEQEAHEREEAERDAKYREEMRSIMSQLDILGTTTAAEMAGKEGEGEQHRTIGRDTRTGNGDLASVERSLIKLKRATLHFVDFLRSENVVKEKREALKKAEWEAAAALEQHSGNSGTSLDGWRSREVVLRSQNPFILSPKATFYKSTFRASHLPQNRLQDLHRRRQAVEKQFQLVSNWASAHPNSTSRENPFLTPLLTLLVDKIEHEDPFVRYHFDLLARRFERFKMFGGRRSDHIHEGPRRTGERVSNPVSTLSHPVSSLHVRTSHHTVDDLRSYDNMIDMSKYLLLLGSPSDADDSLASPARGNVSSPPEKARRSTLRKLQQLEGGGEAATAVLSRQPRYTGKRGAVVLKKNSRSFNGTRGVMGRPVRRNEQAAAPPSTLANLCPLRAPHDPVTHSTLSRHQLFTFGGAYARNSLCESAKVEHFLGSQNAGPDPHGLDERSDASTFFISLASFKDRYCAQTVVDLFRQAIFPSRVFLGIVDQRDPLSGEAGLSSFSCIPPSFVNKRLRPSLGCVVDEECPWASFPSLDSINFSPMDNIRIRHLLPRQAKGPTFGRFISGLMFQGESYFMLLDSHSRMTPGYDIQLLEQVWSLPTRGVLSAYPPPSTSFADYPSEILVNNQTNVTLAVHLAEIETTRVVKLVGGVTQRERSLHPISNPTALLQSQLHLKQLRKASTVEHKQKTLLGSELTLEEAAKALFTVLPDVSWQDLSLATTVMCSSHYLTSSQVNHIIRLDGMSMDGSKSLWRVGSPFLNGHPSADVCMNPDKTILKDGGGSKTHLSRLQPFTAAGFLFSDSAVVLQVPLDPHLDFMFDGEESLYSARLFTAGIDSYAPTSPACAHHYARHTAPRVWSVPKNNWWLHQAGAHLRYHYMMQTQRAEKEMPMIQGKPSNVSHSDEQRLFVDSNVLTKSGKQTNVVRYGMGGCRTVDDFLKIAGADPAKHTTSNSVCSASKRL